MYNDIFMKDLENLVNASNEGKIELFPIEKRIVKKLKNGFPELTQMEERIIMCKIKMLENKNYLNEKLDNEFEIFCEKMKTKSPEEILDKAYEITIKKELKEYLKNSKLNRSKINLLLKKQNILNTFYYDWLHTDNSFNNVLENSIERSFNILDMKEHLIRHRNYRQRKQSNQQER